MHEQRWRDLTEALPQLVWSAMPDGSCDYFSAQWTEHTGVPEADLLGWRWLETLHPDDREPTRKFWLESVAEHHPYDIEYRVRRRDGEYRWFKTRGTPIRDGAGRVVKWFGTCTDISDLRQAEQELRESEERFRGTFENAAVGIVHSDSAGRFLRVNQKFCAIVGYSREELLHKTLQDIIHPDELNAHIEHYESSFARNAPPAFGVERRFLRKDGTTVWVEAYASFQHDASGRPVYVIGAVQDITERKRVEEALRQANARVELAVRSSSISIWECDMPDGRIENAHLTLFNVWESLGYDARTMPTDFSSAFAVFFHPDDLKRVGREIQELLAGDGQEWKNEYRALRKDGSTRWLLARGTVLRDRDGKPVRFIGTSTDITDRKRAEEALRESEQRWRSLTEALPQLVWSATPDGTCDYFSSQWTEHTGLEMADLLGWRWLETLHPDDREPTRRFWLESVAGHHSYDIEYRVRRKGGDYRWFKTRGVPIRDTGGNIVKWFGTCTDITELRDSEERFRGTFENAAVGIGHRHFDGRFLRVNQKFCTILDYSRDELLQRTGQEITHPADLDVGVDLAEALLRGESPGFTLEKRYVRRDGSPVWVDLSVSLQRDGAGNPDYFIGIVQDISNRKRLEEELRRAKEAAEAANRAKDDFLANVSHEIRTPMTAILGMTELVLETPLDEDQRQGLKTVKSAADSLLGIINDLLDFSKIEAGKLELDTADFSLRAAVSDVLRALAVRAHKKGLELIYQVHPDVPDALVGDGGRLRQVLLNLAGNAIKFTDEGEVVLTLPARQELKSASQSATPASAFRPTSRRAFFGPSSRRTPPPRASMAAPAWGSPSQPGSWL
jgi:PAS domain S-box-containing protein